MTKNENPVIEKIAITELKPHPHQIDTRHISDKNFKALQSSLDRGYMGLIVWNKRTGHIVSGHQRAKVLIGQGLKEISVQVVDLPEDEENIDFYNLNNPHNAGENTVLAGPYLEELKEFDEIEFKTLNLDDLLLDVPEVQIANDEDQNESNKKELIVCPSCGHKFTVCTVGA